MQEPPLAETWLRPILQRISSDGFIVSEDVSFEGQEFLAVAHRSRFELAKFGNCETFFVFKYFPTCDTEGLRSYSSLAFRYAKASKSFALPCGLFESVYSFPVAVVDSLDKSTADSVRSEAPRKHYAAAEIPVVYDLSQGKLCFFEKTPVWGALYYNGFRNQIAKHLGS